MSLKLALIRHIVSLALLSQLVGLNEIGGSYAIDLLVPKISVFLSILDTQELQE